MLMKLFKKIKNKQQNILPDGKVKTMSGEIISEVNAGMIIRKGKLVGWYKL